MRPTLVLATRNAAKARELSALLHDVPYRIIDLTGFPMSLPPEGTTSYVENALDKARTVSGATTMVALADDSGLEVDALGGRPGVLSARYGGDEKSDAERCAALLRELHGVPLERRTARYRCVVALCAPSGREATAEGVVEGVLLTAPRGSGGFGYDPLFYYPPLGATFAEIPAGVKHTVSHRGLAMARAREILREWGANES